MHRNERIQNQKSLELICNQVKACALAVKACDKLIRDHRGRSKNSKYVSKEMIRTVVGLPDKAPTEGYRAETIGDTIVVTAINGQKFSLPKSEVERRIAEKKGEIYLPSFNSGSVPTLKYSLNTGGKEVTQQETSKLKKTLKSLAEIVAATAAIISTLAMIQNTIGPAAETAKQAYNGAVAVGGFAKRTLASIKQFLSRHK